MKWTPGYQSNDVEVRDREARGGRGMGLLGGILPLVMSKFGIVGVIVVVGGFFLFQNFVGGGSGVTEQPSAQSTSSANLKADPRVQFASFVLDDVQKSWAEQFAAQNKTYQRAKLVIFQNGTSTGCGYGESATGPFYCPRDQNVYLDLDFFRTLSQKLGANGDFAQAYVIGHEVGHHVQHLLGLIDESGRQQGANGASVRTELQADCFAGIWAHDTSTRDLLENGDLEEALTAAASIGDDRLQKMERGTVQPEKWTHGSSAQRVASFKRGYETGRMDACDSSKLGNP